jgi:hypothetical protein
MAKWATINNSFNSTADTFGGKWGNDISRYLNGIDVGSIDNEKEPIIRTNTRFGPGRLKIYDIDETHTFEFQSDNILSGVNRIFRLKALSISTSDYLVTELEGATLLNKVIGSGSSLGATLDANLFGITKISTLGLRDLDTTNVVFATITGSSANSTISFLPSYNGILGATSIGVEYGSSSKIHRYEWYSTVPGSNTKLFDITPTETNIYTDLDMNGNDIINANVAVTVGNNSILDAQIGAHTSTKITITDKTHLNTNIAYIDQANTFGAFNQTIPSGNFRLSNSGFTSTISSGTLGANITITLPTTTTTLVGTSDSRLSDSRTPTTHATSHKSGGSDSIKINELAAPTSNITTTNATTSASGTLRMLSGNATEYIDGSGNWSVPPGTAGVGTNGSIKGGTATGSGDGTTKVFNIAHGMSTTPVSAIVKPNSINAFGEFVTSIGATNVTITYQNAPPSGTSNLGYEWIAMDTTANANGEVNTYSTVGTGSAITKTKTGVDFPFRSFLAGSTKIGITQNSNDLTFDINEANFTTFAALTHASRHKSGGADAIKVNELAASTTNTTATNSTTTVNGTLPILSGTSTTYLDGTGAWSTPAGGGGGSSDTFSTLGTGLAWTKTKVSGDFQFKSFIAGSNKVTLTSNTNDITINIADANLAIAYSQLTSVPSAIVKTDQTNVFGSFLQTFQSSMLKVMNPLATFGTTIVNSAISANRVLTIPLLTADDTLVTLGTTQTLTNKTLTTPIIATISNTGTITLPTSTDTLIGRATTDTLSNKTLTAPVISTIVNSGTLTLPTITDTLIARTTTDTITNKTIVLASNIVTDTSAVAGDLAVHNGTKFVRKAQGSEGTFFGVQGGTAGYYTPATGSAGTLPDGTSIPATGRWGAIWGGSLLGTRMFSMDNVYSTVTYEIISATENATTLATVGGDDSIAEFRAASVFSRQSNVIFRTKWALKSTSGIVFMTGFSSTPVIPTGGSHDTPLNTASGVMITCSQDIESVYQVSRNDGTGSQVKAATTANGRDIVTHTCEINLNTTNAVVTLDGTVVGTYTTDIPASTTPLYLFMHIEEIGGTTRSFAMYYMQATMS